MKGLGLLVVALGAYSVTCGYWGSNTALSPASKVAFNSWLPISRDSGQRFRSVNCVIQNRVDQMVYAGTNFGLYRLQKMGDYSVWNYFSPFRDLAVTSMFQAQNGNLYIGTHHTLYCVSGKGHFTPVKAFKHGVSAMLQLRNGDICVGIYGGHGFMRYDQRQRQWTGSELAGYYISAFLQRHDGSLWVGDARGGCILRTEEGELTFGLAKTKKRLRFLSNVVHKPGG